MTQRKLQVLAPAPHLSPAYKIARGFYDKPLVVKWLIEANEKRLTRLDEIQHAVTILLVDDESSEQLVMDAEDASGADFEDAVVRGAFNRAARQVYRLNAERVRSALDLYTTSLPSETDRHLVAKLYDTDPHATWLELARDEATYHATGWLLVQAAATPNGRMPMSIRQTLAQVAEGTIIPPQPELAETYQRWGALVLAGMPQPDECID